MDDGVKMWFELVSRYKEQVDRSRRYNLALVIAAIGGIVWLLNVAPWSADWMDPAIIVRCISIVMLLFIIAILLGLNWDLGKADKEFQAILMGILSGELADRKKIWAEYYERMKDMGYFIGSYNAVVERATEK